jgi:hypothetical protein
MIEFFDIGELGFCPTLRPNSQKAKSSTYNIYIKNKSLR